MKGNEERRAGGTLKGALFRVCGKRGSGVNWFFLWKPEMSRRDQRRLTQRSSTPSSSSGVREEGGVKSRGANPDDPAEGKAAEKGRTRRTDLHAPSLREICYCGKILLTGEACRHWTERGSLTLTYRGPETSRIRIQAERKAWQEKGTST